MAWGAETGSVFDSPVPWLLFAANICWSLSYDTAYAFGDRADDLKIGVKSTAIWFGEKAVLAVVLLAFSTLLLLLLAALQLGGVLVMGGWAAAMVLQLLLCARLVRSGESWGFSFFLGSHWVGALFALGLTMQGLFG